VFSKSELGQINAVQLAYQLTFLSELVDKDTLLIQSRFSDLSELSKGDNKLWPVSVPSKEDFVVWRKFLASIIVRDGTLSHTLTKWRHKTEGLTSSQRLQVYEVLHKEWVDKAVQFLSRYNFLSLLIDSKVAFVVDGSFYPTKSYLISAAWFATVNTKIIA